MVSKSEVKNFGIEAHFDPSAHLSGTEPLNDPNNSSESHNTEVNCSNYVNTEVEVIESLYNCIEEASSSTRETREGCLDTGREAMAIIMH